jgi:hypothetical protein
MLQKPKAGRDGVWDVAGTGRGQWEKPGPGFDRKIADRFQHENRSPFFPEKFLIGILIAITIRKSLIDFKMKNADRF